MAQKYVAFGQLIDGERTLQKIEQVPTYYESPKKNIMIFKSGIFNMDCHDITINKRAKEYIFGHIEDLYTIGELFYEASKHQNIHIHYISIIYIILSELLLAWLKIA